MRMGAAGGKGWQWLQLLHIPGRAALPADKAMPMRIAPFTSKKTCFYREILSFPRFFDESPKFCDFQAGC
jgi:hypothetical protein